VLDLEEDEVEEGEILNCPECEVDMEVTSISPVQVNVLSDEDEDAPEKEEDEEAEEEEEVQDEEADGEEERP
jgi:vacuolar-type H+-ATPase subunit D/Vma8